MSDQTHKLWGGRFEGGLDEAFHHFNRSLPFDKRLAFADLRGSKAWAAALGHAGLLTTDEVKKLHAGLDEITAELKAKPALLDESTEEDIHSFIEGRLIARLGDVGRKLHTGRSRNDQVATSFRLWCRDEVDSLIGGLRGLQTAFVKLAESDTKTILPGYTHLQRGQPVLFAHTALAYVEMLGRDEARLNDLRARLNVLPLGSGAVAGCAHAVDRDFLAKELGFDDVTHNSLDAVSDRDFVVETLAALSLLGVHLSRFSEDWILYASSEFSFLELDDSVSTGSSLMPQKKNPDSLELIRGKTGRVVGGLVSIITTLKSLPLAYNKDLQEDKEAVFDALETARGCVAIATKVVSTVKLRPENMRAAASRGFLNATELADYLVRKGLPFRTGHEVVGKLVRLALEKGVELEQLKLEEFRQFAPQIDADVFNHLTLEAAVAAKKLVGGTARERVLEEIQRQKARLK